MTYDDHKAMIFCLILCHSCLFVEGSEAIGFTPGQVAWEVDTEIERYVTDWLYIECLLLKLLIVTHVLTIFIQWVGTKCNTYSPD